MGVAGRGRGRGIVRTAFRRGLAFPLAGFRLPAGGVSPGAGATGATRSPSLPRAAGAVRCLLPRPRRPLPGSSRGRPAPDLLRPEGRTYARGPGNAVAARPRDGPDRGGLR